MTTWNLKKIPFTSSNDPVTSPIPPYQPKNAFIPGRTADLNIALGLFPPNAANIQAKYYATSDIQKLDPDFANQQRIGSIVETGVSMEEQDPGFLGRMTKTTVVLAAIGAGSLLFALL